MITMDFAKSHIKEQVILELREMACSAFVELSVTPKERAA